MARKSDQRKTCVITGATSGIGLAIARALAQKNFELILIGRDEEKGKSVADTLKADTDNSHIHFVKIDLSSQKQIRQGGEIIKSNYPKIDVLINNAGLWTSKLELTEDKIEKQFAVNHLAYFLLTHVLYHNIARSENGRIINIASDSHFFGKIHFDDINLSHSYNGLKAYAQSKLANLLFTYELDRQKKERNISLYCVQPGLVKTDIGMKQSNFFHGLIWRLRRLTGRSPEKAAETPVYLATAEAGIPSGHYWDSCEVKISSALSRNIAVAQRLWNLSKELCGIDNYFK